jgi:putative ABC transport system permease protein
MLTKLAVRNILRQKVRTAMTLAAIMIGVSGLILSSGFVQDIFIQLGEAFIHSQTGHIQVFRKDYIEKGTRQPDRFIIEQPDKLAARIQTLAEVETVSARLNFAGLLNNGKRDLAIIGEGIEPDKEAHIGTYVKVSEGRPLSDKDKYGMFIGQGVAHSMNLHPGDAVNLVMNTSDGALNTLEFTVVGVFQSFSQEFDARAVRIPLPAAQELMQNQGSNVLVISLHKTDDTDTALQAVHGLLDPTQLDARSWRQLSDFYDKTIVLYNKQFGVLEMIILLMVLLSVINSVNMSTFERVAEFGTMQALGNRQLDVFKLLVLESCVLGLAGATLGVLFGALVASIVSAIGIPMPPPPIGNVGYTAYIRIVPTALLNAWIIGLVSTILASLLPARRVVRTPIVDALRSSI